MGRPDALLDIANKSNVEVHANWGILRVVLENNLDLVELEAIVERE